MRFPDSFPRFPSPLLRSPVASFDPRQHIRNSGPIKPTKLFNMTAVHDSWFQKFHHKCQNWIVLLVDLIHVVVSAISRFLSGPEATIGKCHTSTYFSYTYISIMNIYICCGICISAVVPNYNTKAIQIIYFMPKKCQPGDRHNIFLYILLCPFHKPLKTIVSWKRQWSIVSNESPAVEVELYKSTFEMHI